MIYFFSPFLPCKQQRCFLVLLQSRGSCFANLWVQVWTLKILSLFYPAVPLFAKSITQIVFTTGMLARCQPQIITHLTTPQMYAQRTPLSFPDNPDTVWHVCRWEVKLQRYSAPLCYIKPAQEPQEISLCNWGSCRLLQFPPSMHTMNTLLYHCPLCWQHPPPARAPSCATARQVERCFCHHQVLLLITWDCNEHHEQRGRAVLQPWLKIKIYGERLVAQLREII